MNLARLCDRQKTYFLPGLQSPQPEFAWPAAWGTPEIFEE